MCLINYRGSTCGPRPAEHADAGPVRPTVPDQSRGRDAARVGGRVHGRDAGGLNNWDQTGGSWRIEGGEFLGYLPGGSGRISYLKTKKAYRNFLLSFQVRTTPADAGTSVMLRGVGRWDAGGSKSGTVSEARDEAVTTLIPSNDAARQAFRLDGYNDVTVLCHGERLTVRVNGAQVTETDIPDWEPGPVGWRLGPPATEVRVRAVRFAELLPPAAELLVSPSHEWAAPELVTTVYSAAEKSEPTISADGTVLVFASTRGEDGRLRLWESRRGQTAAPCGAPTSVEAANHPTAGTRQPFLSPDGRALLFASARPGSEPGLWLCRRATLRGVLPSRFFPADPSAPAARIRRSHPTG